MPATPPDFSVIIRAPRDYLGSRYANYYDKSGRNVRHKDLVDVWVPPAETQAKFVCLRSPSSSWITDSGLTTITYEKEGGAGIGSFVYAYNSFGVGDGGVAQNDTDITWWAHTKTAYEINTCPVVYGRWMPNGIANSPKIEIYPTMDLLKTFTCTYNYYFAPFFVKINGFESLQIYEYEHDDYAAFDANNTSMFNMTNEIFFGPTTSTSIDSNVYWSIGFIPLGVDGVYIYGNINSHSFGTAYYSKVERVNMPLMPSGCVGARYTSLGAGLIAIGKSTFAASGTVTSQLYSKSESNVDYPTVTFGEYVPEDTDITGVLVDGDGVTIVQGDAFQDYKTKLTLTTSDTAKTPILFDVDIDFEGLLEEYIDSGIDISSYVMSIQERAGIEVGDFSGTIQIKNPNGILDWLIGRVAHEIVYTVNGVPRALLYTGDMGVELYRVPGQESYFVSWDCGDGWKKLQDQLCFNIPALDGMTVKTGLTQFFTYLGWDPSKLDIDDIDFTFPAKRGGQDYFYKPEDGQPAAEFLKDLYEQLFRRYIMRFDGSGKFQLKQENQEVVNRTFYLGVDGAAAGFALANIAYSQGELDDPPDVADFQYFVMGDVSINYLYNDYVNEIWVMGYDPLCDYINTALWVDLESQFNPYYPNYIGDRKLVFLLINIANQGIVDYTCQAIADQKGIVRLRIEFRSKYDPLLRAGDFISIFPHQSLFRIEALDIEVADGVVDYSEGNMYGMKITALSWPMSYDEEFNEDVE